MFNKIFLVAGHHNKDSGAIYSHTIKGNEIKFTESDLTKEFRDLLFIELSKYIDNKRIIKDNDDEDLGKVINWLNEKASKNDLIIDLHFNAASEAANGTEVFIRDYSTNSEIELSTEIKRTICNSINTRSRGIKKQNQSARKRIGILNLPKPTILIEVCFITNEKDISNYIINKHLLVSELAKTIDKFLIKY
ncbi:N-acetylmuramoyl-L-alanine amidase [Echinicola shivajiensis]|uniref:N-acetylmuramoyl-L-alanine amidase n=1 Tax=Echinicola shivajiensis TaxID=1035916 RepID=UPI001BFCAA1E|nr:N-acetylmuramoyl-L-alanine amidase [Echinicola shivajiensis]